MKLPPGAGEARAGRFAALEDLGENLSFFDLRRGKLDIFGGVL